LGIPQMMIETSDRRTLRVWHIAELYPPDYGGGAAVYIRDVCRFLADRGHEVRVLCTEDSDRPPYSIRTEYDGAVRVDRLSLPHFRRHDPGGWMLGLRGWRRHQKRIMTLAGELLATWTPDLVQFHTPHALYEECSAVIERHEVPVVGMLHCAWLICPRLRLIRSPGSTSCSGPAPLKCLGCLYSHWDGSWSRAGLKLPWRLMKLGAYPAYRLWSRTETRKHVSGLIAYSEFMRTVHDGLVPGSVQHISLGIDLADRPAGRPVRPRTPLRFGFIGGFQEHKGIWDVLDAAARLNRRGLAFELHIWGPNQDPGPVRQRGLEERVVLHGMFAPREKWSVYEQFDVLLMATRDQEPYGRVIQEAAAAGAPSIAPATGGIAEQIRDGFDGLLFRVRDSADLEAKMERVVSEPPVVARLSENLWPVIDTRDAVARIEEFYYQLIQGHAPKNT
jgi:glycosyltransferase involved in cell wall biosynthesis